jgi:hypothetical protein
MSSQLAPDVVRVESEYRRWESWVALSSYLVLLLGLAAVSANTGGFDSPEDAVRGLEQAYMQKNVDRAVAALDFVEEGRQLLQETNPLLAGDAESIKHAAELLERSFREELTTKGFPDFSNLKCMFVGKAQVAPELIKLTEQCTFPDGRKRVQDVMVKHSSGWRVVLASPVF